MMNLLNKLSLALIYILLPFDLLIGIYAYYSVVSDGIQNVALNQAISWKFLLGCIQLVFTIGPIALLAYLAYEDSY